jgi:hypothetical protein
MIGNSDRLRCTSAKPSVTRAWATARSFTDRSAIRSASSISRTAESSALSTPILADNPLLRPRLTDAELVTLVVLQALRGFTFEAWLACP